MKKININDCEDNIIMEIPKNSIKNKQKSHSKEESVSIKIIKSNEDFDGGYVDFDGDIAP